MTRRRADGVKKCDAWQAGVDLRVEAHRQRVEREEPAQQREERERLDGVRRRTAEEREHAREARAGRGPTHVDLVIALLLLRGPLTAEEARADLGLSRPQWGQAVYSRRGRRLLRGRWPDLGAGEPQVLVGDRPAKVWVLTEEGAAEAARMSLVARGSQGKGG